MVHSQAAQSTFDALVFDLGGVIVAHDNMMMLERLASRCDPQARPDVVQAMVFHPKWDTGEVPLTTLHEELQDQLGYGRDWAGFVDDWCCHFTQDWSMLALLQDLSKRHRVMLFSNTNKEHWDFEVRTTDGALGRFERYLSFEMGLRKPSIEAFGAVASSAGIDPARSVFFDDRADNVEGARLAGFQAEVFTDETWLRGYLESIGVR